MARPIVRDLVLFLAVKISNRLKFDKVSIMTLVALAYYYYNML